MMKVTVLPLTVTQCNLCCSTQPSAVKEPQPWRAGAQVPQLLWGVLRVCFGQLVLSMVCKELRNLVMK